MIISHTYKFIFIKNRKVGSTSVEQALQPICGLNDVLTPDHLHNSEHDVLMPMARNYEGRFFPLREILQSRRPIDAARVLRDATLRPRFYNHIRASSVKARVSPEIWNTYYKFCFERNPWDKMVSFYYWFGRSKKLPEFNQFVQNHKQYGSLDQVIPSDWGRYTLHNQIIIDEVFDFADLAGGLQTALSNAGVPTGIISQIKLGNEKSNLRKKVSHDFESETNRIIGDAFAFEIAAFPFCSPHVEG